MVKHRVRFGTIDGDFFEEREVDIPTEEEKEAERQKLYPDTSKASYLQYPCHYCGNTFYRIFPYRNPNMNPPTYLFICIYDENYKKYYENNRNYKELGRLIPVCRSCFKEMTDKGESIIIKPGG
jgi:hypothetical protein